jgi:hypothetical protein
MEPCVLFLICYNDFKHVWRISENVKTLLISMIGLLFAFELETIVSGFENHFR